MKYVYIVKTRYEIEIPDVGTDHDENFSNADAKIRAFEVEGVQKSKDVDWVSECVS